MACITMNEAILFFPSLSETLNATEDGIMRRLYNLYKNTDSLANPRKKTKGKND